MTKKHLVWDLPTRLFHWILVILIAAQWFTAEQGDEYLSLHFYLGYATLSLIVFRIIWGLVGTRYALFSDFLVSPRQLLAYLAGKLPSTPGHPPLGGLMVVVLLITILLQALSGLVTSDEIFTDGPFRSLLSDEWQGRADWLHGNLFLVIQVAVTVHVGAAFYYLLFRKENLISAMFSGKKVITKEQAIPSSKVAMALIIVLLVIAALALALFYAPAPIDDEYY